MRAHSLTAGLFLMGFLLAPSACSSNSETARAGTDAEGSPRVRLGKADSTGSCVDHCAEKSEGNCWCDDKCAQYGDCCDDYLPACSNEGDSAGSCAGPAGNYCGGRSAKTCWCDDKCAQYGDCCEDYAAVCEAPDCAGADCDAIYVTMGDYDPPTDGPGTCPPERDCTLTVRIDDPWMQQVAVGALRGQNSRRYLSGRVALSPADYNVDSQGKAWSWHLTDVGFANGAVEYCDTGPDLLEAAIVAGQIPEGHAVCFWNHLPVSARRADGSVISPIPQGPTDCPEATAAECSERQGCAVTYTTADSEYQCGGPGAPNPCPGSDAMPFECFPESVPF